MNIAYKTQNVIQVNSSGITLFTADLYSIIDSIFITNTTRESILINVQFLREGKSPTFLFNNYKLSEHATVELMKNSALYLQPTDSLIGCSDYSRHLFDCHISYREVLEE